MNSINYVHMFQYNIPVDNEFTGRTDSYINVIAEWNGKDTYYDGRPMVSVTPVTHHFADIIIVKDWYWAKCDIERIAESHFAEIARQEKIAQARATLISEGEPTGVPTLDRYTEAIHDLIIQETLS